MPKVTNKSGGPIVVDGIRLEPGVSAQLDQSDQITELAQHDVITVATGDKPADDKPANKPVSKSTIKPQKEV